MRRGPWHQFGDRSQKLVVEQLRQGVGVGVIISPRDLPWAHAVNYAQEYHALGAHVLIDQQFYVPDFRNDRINTYPISQFRMNPSLLHQITDADLARFSNDLFTINQSLSAEGLIAPALIYEAGRLDIMQLNAKLFNAAKKAGDLLGIPTYATVMIGNTAVTSNELIKNILSHATSLNSDGFYYGFEFSPERIPSSRETVLTCCSAGLTLACTGLPVLHAYAGPMALLSLGFGATGAAIGHFKNLWRLTRSRWGPTPDQGGGGYAPPRFFSSSLWGTIKCPDEVVRLSPTLQSQVLTHSPFSSLLTPSSSFADWPKWDAEKHKVHTICSVVSAVAANGDPRINANTAITLLQGAVTLHNDIATAGLPLGDDTNVYQENWQLAMDDLLTGHSRDFDYLALLPSIQ